MNVESVSDHNAKTRARSLLIASSKEVPSSLLEQNLSHYVRNSLDDVTSKDIDVAGLMITGMLIEDRVHRMHLSLLDVESSNIAIQSVLKKKEKEETCIT